MCHSALGELFAEEDLALKTNQAAPLLDLSEKAPKELKTLQSSTFRADLHQSCWVVVGEERDISYLV